MRIKSMALAAALACAAAAALVGAPAPAQAEGGLKAQKCLKCHTEFKGQDNLVAGDFMSRSNKAKSISVEVAPGKNQIIKFTPETTVVNVENVKALKKPIPVAVTFKKVGSDLVATQIMAKPKIQVPDNQLVDVAQVKQLVAKDIPAGKATLVDSRPPVRYAEGHIPGSISIPFPAMPKLMGKLPKDKDALVVFYCGGFR